MVVALVQFGVSGCRLGHGREMGKKFHLFGQKGIEEEKLMLSLLLEEERR